MPKKKGIRFILHKRVYGIRLAEYVTEASGPQLVILAVPHNIKLSTEMIGNPQFHPWQKLVP